MRDSRFEQVYFYCVEQVKVCKCWLNSCHAVRSLCHIFVSFVQLATCRFVLNIECVELTCFGVFEDCVLS